MLIARTRMQQLKQSQQLQQQSSQRVGALLIHHPAWVDQHTGGSRLTHPQYTGARKGWLWVAHCDQTAQQYKCRNTPKHGSGAMSIQGKSCNKIHENHDDQYSVKCPIPGDGYR